MTYQPTIRSPRRTAPPQTPWALFVQQTLLPWSRLVRVANLFTVFGDPLAGFLLAALLLGSGINPWRLIAVAISSVFLYAFGTIQNDWCDLTEDSRHRPERPLPSKQITPAAAALGALVCAAVALFFALLLGRWPFFVALFILALVTAYNVRLKKTLGPGSLCMGLCRGANVLLGAACVGFPFGLFPLVIAETIYITTVTWLADGENRVQIPHANVYYLPLSFAIGALVSLPFLPGDSYSTDSWLSFVCLVMALIVTFGLAAALHNRTTRPERMRAAIGLSIRALIPWQAGWIALYGTEGAQSLAIIVLTGLVFSSVLGRRISIS
ncbi:UbiA family prenyltransferase [Oligosphaera ethanolica]|jgi:4-hydroxybenzoate polyprenyltransferase|uniref:4-hydroxybenzoate polyprenyltransferase n=1 Tax=Oligosphaera ethanolica TaxID=760260 RepID=A0AAE4ANJ3_9BACT|nr:UbiA family prenyltransferase [Oligosphaera ethanolica]MDQ0290349.1 4-hydroxybenzoate polyprenyltransferase [Oligosphaera ethanolica]HQL10250.1 UbiA family prenyltransferase [Lentisphaeria bacterium]